MVTVEPKFTLQVLWQSDEAIRVTPFKEGSVLESTVKTSRVCPFHSQLVAERARHILSILARANAGVDGLLDELIAAGQAIYVDLLPAFLKDKLEDAQGHNLLLHLDRPLAGIPWELLHDGDEFLGRRFRIGRVVSVEGEQAVAMRRDMRPPLSLLVVADPRGNLPAALAEAEEVVQLMEGAEVVDKVTLLAGDVSIRHLRDALGEHDLFHYAGHAEMGSETQGLALSDGVFGAALLEQLAGRVDMPGLVFLNGCGSAHDTVRLSEGSAPFDVATGLASSLLMGGARHVVGSIWEVRDDVARQFATRFYGALTSGETVGTAMERGRASLMESHGEDRLFWAAHLLYGDPTWRLSPPPQDSTEDFTVLDGLEAKSQQDLASPDSTTRVMAVTMLLRLGDRSVLPALEKDLETLLGWFSPDASRQQQRMASHVLQALASAAGLQSTSAPDVLPDAETVRTLYQRLLAGDGLDGEG